MLAAARMIERQRRRLQERLAESQKSRPFRDHRQAVDGIINRLRTGIAWRDLPASARFQTVPDRFGHLTRTIPCRRTELRLYPNDPIEHVLVGSGLNGLCDAQGLYGRNRD